MAIAVDTIIWALSPPPLTIPTTKLALAGCIIASRNTPHLLRRTWVTPGESMSLPRAYNTQQSEFSQTSKGGRGACHIFSESLPVGSVLENKGSFVTILDNGLGTKHTSKSRIFDAIAASTSILLDGVSTHLRHLSCRIKWWSYFVEFAHF